MQAKTAIWMYNQEGGRIFKAGEEIPQGYVDSPAKVKPAQTQNASTKGKARGSK